MKQQLKFEQFIPEKIETVWDFFSDSNNLLELTPKSMNMKVISDLKETKLFEGMLIQYYISPLFKIPIYWETEIIKVEKCNQFIDIQTKGPFKFWKHTHTFIEKGNGVLMIDTIEYELPFGFLGDLVHKPLVLKNLLELFEYRRKICEEKFQ